MLLAVFVTLLLAALFYAGLSVGGDGPRSSDPSLPATTQTVAMAACSEDSPDHCWVWSRMGNRRRAVVDLRTGKKVVVGPCAFRQLWLYGNADLSKPSQQMKGDWWAIHNGCKPTTPQSGGTLYVHPTGNVEAR